MKKKHEEREKIFDLNSQNHRIGHYLREWAKKAKINKYLTYHVSRHTFATMSLTYGVDLYTVSKLMGHKSIKMTEVYARIINEKLDEAANKMPKL